MKHYCWCIGITLFIGGFVTGVVGLAKLPEVGGQRYVNGKQVSEQQSIIESFGFKLSMIGAGIMIIGSILLFFYNCHTVLNDEVGPSQVLPQPRSTDVAINIQLAESKPKEPEVKEPEAKEPEINIFELKSLDPAPHSASTTRSNRSDIYTPYREWRKKYPSIPT